MRRLAARRRRDVVAGIGRRALALDDLAQAVTYGTRALARTALRRDSGYDRAQLRALGSAVRRGTSH